MALIARHEIFPFKLQLKMVSTYNLITKYAFPIVYLNIHYHYIPNKINKKNYIYNQLINSIYLQ